MKTIGCPICSESLTIKVARGRKSNKPFIMLVCRRDGRHFRGFITDQDYVKRVLEGHKGDSSIGVGVQGMGRERE